MRVGIGAPLGLESSPCKSHQQSLVSCHFHACCPADAPPWLPHCAHQADDGEFVALATKHTFNLGTLGILLGMLGHLQGGWPADAVVWRQGGRPLCGSYHMRMSLREHRQFHRLKLVLLPTPSLSRAGPRALQRPVQLRLAPQHNRHAAVRGRCRLLAVLLLPLCCCCAAAGMKHCGLAEATFPPNTISKRPHPAPAHAAPPPAAPPPAGACAA